MAWRYVAQRMRGDGGFGEFIADDLPLTNVTIEEVLTGHHGLSASISPELSRLQGADGRPIFDEWKTAIWAMEDGTEDVYGGILHHSGLDGPQWSLECIGYTGYATDMPYTDAKFFVEVDPIDIFRHIWKHLQSQTGGDLGLQVADTKSGIIVGTELEQGEFDTEQGPLRFESGPYKLAWYQDHDLSSNLEQLAADTPFDWRERHYWQGDEIKHALDIGYPTLGQRRKDLTFIIGENVFLNPAIERDGEVYATEALVLGAGEGRKMLRGIARRDIDGLRRVAVVTDSSLRKQKQVDRRAEREVAARAQLEDISEIVVLDHPHAPLGAVGLGDEILLQGRAPWTDVEVWVRVLSRTRSPSESNKASLAVVRTDRLGR